MIFSYTPPILCFIILCFYLKPKRNESVSALGSKTKKEQTWIHTQKRFGYTLDPKRAFYKALLLRNSSSSRHLLGNSSSGNVLKLSERPSKRSETWWFRLIASWVLKETAFPSKYVCDKNFLSKKVWFFSRYAKTNSSLVSST